MVDVAGEIGVRWTKRLLNTCMKQRKVPEDWRTGLIFPIWKRKGDAQEPGKYGGITLLSHIMKLLERILGKRLRERVEHELGEEQLGFRKGRGTTDGMFSLQTRHNFVGEIRFFFSENLYQSVSFICVGVSRIRLGDSYRDGVRKKIATLCNKNRPPVAKNQNRSFTSRGATVGLGLRL